MRQAAEAAVRPDKQHVSAPRRGQLAVLTACADAMRDLPLRKIPEEVILASQRRGIRKALLASTTWSGRRHCGSTRR